MKLAKLTFNFFDLAISAGLIIALFCAIVGVQIYQKQKPQETEITCVLRLPPSESSYPFQIGDEVKNENGTVLFGTVTQINNSEYQKVFLKNGEPVYGAVEGLFETELSVNMRAKLSDSYRVGDIRICAGTKGTYRIGSVYVSGVFTVSVSEGGCQ